MSRDPPAILFDLDAPVMVLHDAFQVEPDFRALRLAAVHLHALVGTAPHAQGQVFAFPALAEIKGIPGKPVNMAVF